MPNNEIIKRYMVEFGSAMVGYAVTLIPAIWISEHWLAESNWRFAVVVVPVLPLGMALRAYLRYLSRIDEFQQRIQIQAIAFAAGATGMITFTLGLMEAVGFPRMPLVWVFPIMVGLWGISSTVATQRYN